VVGVLVGRWVDKRGGTWTLNVCVRCPWADKAITIGRRLALPICPRIHTYLNESHNPREQERCADGARQRFAVLLPLVPALARGDQGDARPQQRVVVEFRHRVLRGDGHAHAAQRCGMGVSVVVGDG
jgi:hypothetical protein